MNYRFKPLLIGVYIVTSLKFGFAQETYMASAGNKASQYYLMDRAIVDGHSNYGGFDYKQAWIKCKPAPNQLTTFRKDRIANRKKYGLSTKGYQFYAYSIQLWQCNCVNKKYREVQLIDYDKDGNVLDSYEKDDFFVDWQNSVPETVGEQILDYICHL